MKEQFKLAKTTGSIRVSLDAGRIWEAEKKDVLRAIISISEDYQRQGYKLTLRQLYYQLVSKDYIPNHDKVYKKLSSLKDDDVYRSVLKEQEEDVKKISTIIKSLNNEDENN